MSEAKSDVSSFDSLDELSVRTVRVLSADIVERAKSGHPGAPIGMAPAAHVLFTRFLHGNPKNAQWPNRDRFVLSNGHACALQYAMLHLCGYQVSMQDLQGFRQLGSVTPGHPEVGVTDGIEVSTGPLGQGIAQGVGLAIAAKHMAARFNKEGFPVFDHRVYVFCGDGCLQEGVSSEASSLAGHLGLDNLVVVYDDNTITIDGHTELSFTERVAERYRAYGWNTLVVENGNDDLSQISRALEQSQKSKAPTLILLKTTIGYKTTKENTHGVHGSPLGAESLAAFKKAMGFDPNESFVVNDDVMGRYAEMFAQRGARKETAWNEMMQRYGEEFKEESATLKRLFAGELPSDEWMDRLPQYDENSKATATRNMSGEVLNALALSLPELVGGSADLTPSTKTQLKCSHDFQKTSYDGRYFRFGVREFGMFAICNGIAAYGCLIPFSATFLNFITYGFGAVRLGALSHLRQIYVMTHDSIFLGEDGPTHQPVEVLPLLRATPNLHLMRPADGKEIVGCYIHALRRRNPTVLCFSRQTVPHLSGTSRDDISKGAYVVSSSDEKEKEKRLVLISTGSEVHKCVAAQTLLAREALSVNVVSAPCLELFDEQTLSYKSQLLGNALVVSVEASTTLGWSKYAHYHIGVNGFGASGPLKAIESHFGFTAEAIATRSKALADACKEQTLPLLPCLLPVV